jgi:hypothetical protein
MTFGGYLNERAWDGRIGVPNLNVEAHLLGQPEVELLGAWAVLTGGAAHLALQHSYKQCDPEGCHRSPWPVFLSIGLKCHRSPRNANALALHRMQ